MPPLAILLLAFAIAFSALYAPGRAFARTGPGDADPSLYDAVAAPYYDAVYAETRGVLTRYRIEATFAPARDDRLATIAGTLELRFINLTDESLAELYLRLYSNGDEYADGEMTIDRATANGEDLAIVRSADGTLATIALPAKIPVGEASDLVLAFTTTIPTDPVGSYGMFSYDEHSGTYALAHWLPLLAGYDPVNGWELGPTSTFGDPVFTNSALFDVQLTLPENLVVATTGSEVESTAAERGMATRRFVSGPVRDFVMAIDDDFEVERITVGETTVNSYYNPDSAEQGLEVLTAGAQSLAFFNRILGDYPYAELDLVQIDLGNGAGGVEFPQLMFIGGDYYDEGAATRSIPGFLEFIVAHEVAHQWFYAMVGNNQYRHAFIDEGLSNYLTTLYFADAYGQESGEEQTNYNLKAAYFSVLFDDGDQIVDQPTDDFPSQRSYGAIVYGKAALGFGAIHDAIGDKAFYAALRGYVNDFRFDVAGPTDLLAAFEAAAGADLDELWRHWFEAAEGREDFDAADFARLLSEIGR